MVLARDWWRGLYAWTLGCAILGSAVVQAEPAGKPILDTQVQPASWKKSKRITCSSCPPVIFRDAPMGEVVQPGQPGAGEVGQPGAAQPEAAQPTEPNLADQVAQPGLEPLSGSDPFSSSMDVASSARGRAPNLIGDFFGGAGNVVNQVGVIDSGMTGGVVPGSLNGALVSINVDQVFTNALPPIPGQPFSFFLGGAGSTITAFLPDGSVIQQPVIGFDQEAPPGAVLGAPSYPLPTDTFVQDTINAFLTANAATITTLLTDYQLELTPGVEVQSATVVPSGDGTAFETDPNLFLLNYPAAVSIFVGRPDAPIIFDVPSPSASALVGRGKISENNSPMPRDRVFFGYNYFNNVPLSPNGVDVSRFSPGFEKTFFNQRASVEVRFPFASTLSSSILADGASDANDMEFGNITTIVKALVYSSDTLNVATGMGIYAPTGDDVVVRHSVLGELIRVNNTAVHLQPYVGALWTPNDRFFAQGFLQVDLDANGNTVYMNPFLTGLTKAGVLTDQNTFFADLQMGYWIFQQDYGFLTGIAPLLEFHYAGALGNPDVIQSGNLVVTSLLGNYQIVNFTVGTVIEIANNTNVLLGFVAPFTQGRNRQFDWEFGVMVNHYFGRSATRAQRASVF